jgi:hypothetical protein
VVSVGMNSRLRFQALAVLVDAGGADFGPVGVLAFAPDVVDAVGGLSSGLLLAHDEVLLLVRDRTLCGLSGKERDPGHERTCQQRRGLPGCTSAAPTRAWKLGKPLAGPHRGPDHPTFEGRLGRIASPKEKPVRASTLNPEPTPSSSSGQATPRHGPLDVAQDAERTGKGAGTAEAQETDRRSLSAPPYRPRGGSLRMRSCIPQKHPPASTVRPLLIEYPPPDRDTRRSPQLPSGCGE